MRWAYAAAVVLATLAAGCGGDDEATRTTDDVPRGGTLRIGTTGGEGRGEITTIDPALLHGPEISELQRCCLLRTLVSYRGAPTEEGGAILRPDLAVGLPRVSDDGLTYTFTLKDGLRYAPPYEGVPIRSQDVVRGLEYGLRLGPGFATAGYLVIEGADAFQRKQADTVSGLETPDERTLVVHLRERIGDLAEKFSSALTAPIPEGADVGHRDFGRVLVASGPYMIEGAAGYDFSRPPSLQRLPSGFVRDRRLTLVRNPSWSSDALRKGYADRIVLSVESSPERAAAKVDRGALDVALGQLSPPREQLQRYQADPELRKRVFAHVMNSMRYINLNVAVPPFDDIHVRKAANLVVDKRALFEAARGGLGGRIAGHISPDALLNNLLLDYDPYETPGHGGDVNAARAEMARSRYDRNRDGRCDAAVCRNVTAPVRNDEPTNARLGEIIRDNLRAIGIELKVEAFDADTYFGSAIAPERKLALIPSLGWSVDVLNAAGVFPPLFAGALAGSAAGTNLSLVGASPRQLERIGYPPRKLPSVDRKLGECLRLTGRAQTQCWAETDQLLMERVVPWVPYLFEGKAQVVSSRIARFSFAQAAFGVPAVDQIALKPGSS